MSKKRPGKKWDEMEDRGVSFGPRRPAPKTVEEALAMLAEIQKASGIVLPTPELAELDKLRNTKEKPKE